MSVASPSMTTAELLALPENGTDRWLIAGELRECPMPTRNRFHSRAMTCTATELEIWLRAQPSPRGQILSGDAGVRLRRNPDTTVGVDVVYVSADVLTRQAANTTIVDGVPILAVEILSPSDMVEAVNEKIDSYLDAGVPWVWIPEPHRRTVTTYRPGAEPELFTPRDTLSDDSLLPGFRVTVAKLFD